MPYIKQTERIGISLEALAAANLLEDAGPGVLNFYMSKLLWTLFDRCETYGKANEIMGVLEAVRLEFYRRKVAPYEDKKCEENGDL